VIKVAGTALNDAGITSPPLPTSEFIHNAQNDAFTQGVSEEVRDLAETTRRMSTTDDGLAQALKNNAARPTRRSLHAALHASASPRTTGPIASIRGDRPHRRFSRARDRDLLSRPPAIRLGGVWKGFRPSRDPKRAMRGAPRAPLCFGD